jgi:chromosome segregation ATPase
MNTEKQTIRNELKIIRARIKDKRKTYEKINRICETLWSEIDSLEATEERLKRDLSECE